MKRLAAERDEEVLASMPRPEALEEGTAEVQEEEGGEDTMREAANG